MGLEDSAWKVFTYQFAGKPVLADGAALRLRRNRKAGIYSVTP